MASPDVFVNLGKAVICFAHTCFPALVGPTTPAGIYDLTHYATEAPDYTYGGDILVFREDNDDVWAIHRVINIPGQHRKERLAGGNVHKRRNITLGCINIDPVVYEKLVDCCSNSKLYIIP
jgi:hypothetical protein